MKSKIIYLALLGILLTLTGASCNSCSSKTVGGGIFRSDDQAETWAQKVFIKKVKRTVYSIDEYSILSIQFDPLESNVIYIGTKGNGLLVSKNAGENWETTKQNTGNVYSIDIDPKNNSIIYITKDTSIVRSVDKGENWDVVHTDTKKQRFSKIIVDTYDSNKIYAASLSGIVYKSVDKGNNWEIKLQISSGIQNLFMRPDSRILYALTEEGDVLKTTTGGEITGDISSLTTDEKELENATWKSIFTKEHASEWPTAKKATKFFIYKFDPISMYMTSKHGILKSIDEGKTWQEINTLIPVDDSVNTKIRNLEIDPVNPNNIYFNLSSSAKIYKSIDAGKNWHIIENFPSTKNINVMKLDPYNPTVLFSGMDIPEEKKGLIK